MGAKKKYHMISVVAELFDIHPQTLRLYEKEGLLEPARSTGNTRLYSEDDLERLEVILNLTRSLGVNLAGVEVVLNMRDQMEQMQQEISELVEYVRVEIGRDVRAEQKGTRLVKRSSNQLIRMAVNKKRH